LGVGDAAGGWPSFEEEFDELFARAFAIARRLTGDPALAEDIAAEALARAYAAWRRVRTYEYRGAWVARVATNLAIDVARKRRIDVPVTIATDPADGPVLRLALVEALSRLPRRRELYDRVVARGRMLKWRKRATAASFAVMVGRAPGCCRGDERAPQRRQDGRRRTLGEAIRCQGQDPDDDTDFGSAGARANDDGDGARDLRHASPGTPARNDPVHHHDHDAPERGELADDHRRVSQQR
jgi:DNA-directed RNA polymerase specialized sigma24 family protein